VRNFIIALREIRRAMFHQFGTFIGSVLTVFLATLVAGSFAQITKNTGIALDRLKEEASIEVYLKSDIDSLTQNRLQNNLVANRFVTNILFVSKDRALFRLRETFGQQMVAGLKTNPLPASYEVTLETEVYEGDNFQALIDSLYKIAGVEDVGYVPSAIPKLKLIFKILTFLGLVMGLLVMVATGFIIGNAIHVKIAERRNTFYIMRLVGASSGFIRAPYLVTGTIIGLLGGALSIAVLKLATVFIARFMVPISFFDAVEIACFIAASGLIGFSGSHLALKKYLEI